MLKIKEVLKNEKYYSIIIILIASIFVCIPLMSKNIDMTYDDGIQHIARLMGTYQSIQEGQISIMSNFCNGFGYSWNIFYSPITALAPLIFKLLGVSFTTCIKLFMFVVIFLSGYFMYIFTKKVTNNNNVSIVAAILYIFAPYRLTDMYIRNALAELASFMFLPMIFLGLYNIFNEESNKKINLWLIIGAAGLTLTHTIITMYTAILALIYILINLKELKKKSIQKKLIVCTVLVLIITAFFWMPLLEHKLAAEYEVFKDGRMERTEVLVAYKLDFYRLFFTKSNDYMIYDIGLVVLIGLVLTPFAVKKVKETKYYKLYLFMLISGVICAVMTLKIFPFEYLPKTLKMIQFSFRLLEFTSFFFAFIAAINIGIVSKKFELKEVFIVLAVTMLLTCPYTSYVRTLQNFDESILWPSVPVTEQTGRVHAGCASFEYLPCKAFENRKYIEDRSNQAIILSGTAQIENEQKNGSQMSFDINYVLEETQIELPYIYYLGYNVTLTVDEKIQKLKTFETDNGFVGVQVPILENGKIDVKYTGTAIMNFSKLISIAGVCFIIFEIIYGRKHKITIN